MDCSIPLAAHPGDRCVIDDGLATSAADSALPSPGTGFFYLVRGNKGGLPVEHWSAAGFGDTDPVANNASKDGQQKNRRCDLIVVPSVEEMLDLKTLTQ